MQNLTIYFNQQSAPGIAPSDRNDIRARADRCHAHAPTRLCRCPPTAVAPANPSAAAAASALLTSSTGGRPPSSSCTAAPAPPCTAPQQHAVTPLNPYQTTNRPQVQRGVLQSCPGQVQRGVLQSRPGQALRPRPHVGFVAPIHPPPRHTHDAALHVRICRRRSKRARSASRQSRSLANRVSCMRGLLRRRRRERGRGRASSAGRRHVRAACS
jgi:hypothetical protein